MGSQKPFNGISGLSKLKQKMRKELDTTSKAKKKRRKRVVINYGEKYRSGEMFIAVYTHEKELVRLVEYYTDSEGNELIRDIIEGPKPYVEKWADTHHNVLIRIP